MTLRALDTIDLASFDKTSNQMILSILDDTAWDSERDEAAYLGKKIETCLNGIDSGELLKMYGEQINQDLPIIINVICAKPLPKWVRQQVQWVFQDERVAALHVSLEITKMRGLRRFMPHR
jgi:hypothetical protein